MVGASTFSSSFTLILTCAVTKFNPNRSMWMESDHMVSIPCSNGLQYKFRKTGQDVPHLKYLAVARMQYRNCRSLLSRRPLRQSGLAKCHKGLLKHNINIFKLRIVFIIFILILHYDELYSFFKKYFLFSRGSTVLMGLGRLYEASRLHSDTPH
jgi:hypothetical protein